MPKVQLFKTPSSTPVGAGLHGFASAEGAIVANVDFHRGIDMTTSLDLEGKVGAAIAGALRAALSAGGSARGAGALQVGFPLDLFSEKGGGLIAMLRLQLEAAGFVEATVGMDPAKFEEEIAKTLPGPLAQLLDIFLEELVVDAGVWGHAGLTAQLVAEVELTGRLLPVDKAGFTFAAKYAAGWYFGYGLNYITNFTFHDTRRMLDRLATQTSAMLLSEADRVIATLPPAEAGPARAALPFLRVLMPVATRAMFEVAAQLATLPEGQHKDQAARSIVGSIFSQAQQTVLHALFDLALTELKELLGGVGPLDQFLTLDAVERTSVLNDLHTLRDHVAALEDLSLDQPDQWLATVIDCLSPLEALVTTILPRDAAQTVAKVWACARLAEQVLPWLTGDGAQPPDLVTDALVDPSGAPASAAFVAKESGTDPAAVPLRALVDLVAGTDPMPSLAATAPDAAAAVEWLAQLTGAPAGELVRHVLDGLGSLAAGDLDQLVTGLATQFSAVLEDRVIPHLLDPIEAGADAELAAFIDELVRPLLTALPHVVLPRLAALGTKEAGSRLVEAISAVLLQTTSHYVLNSLDLLIDQWLTEGADDLERVAEEMFALGRKSPVYSSVAAAGAALVIGVDVQPAEVRDLLNICAHTMRLWNEHQRHPTLETTRLCLDLGLRAGGFKELDVVLGSDSPPNLEALLAASGEVTKGALLMLADPETIRFASLLPFSHAFHQGEMVVELLGVAVETVAAAVVTALHDIGVWATRIDELVKTLIPAAIAAVAGAVDDVALHALALVDLILTRIHDDVRGVFDDVSSVLPPELREPLADLFEAGFADLRHDIEAPLLVLHEVSSWVRDIFEEQRRTATVDAAAARDGIRATIYNRPAPTLQIPLDLPLPPPFNVQFAVISIDGTAILRAVANVVLADPSVNAGIEEAATHSARQVALEAERVTLVRASAAKYTPAQAEAARKVAAAHPSVTVSVAEPTNGAIIRGPAQVVIRVEGADSDYLNGHPVIDMPGRVVITVNDQYVFGSTFWRASADGALELRFRVLPPVNDDPPTLRKAWDSAPTTQWDPQRDPLRRSHPDVLGLAGVNTVSVSTVDPADPAKRTVACTFSMPMPKRADLLMYNQADGTGTLGSVAGQVDVVNPDPVRDWGAVVAGAFRPQMGTDLACYAPVSGLLKVSHIDRPTGQVQVLGSSGVRTGASLLCPGDFAGDGAGSVVLHSPGSAQAEVWTSDGAGGLGRLEDLPGLRAGVTVLAAGDFNHDGADELLAYDPTSGLVSLWRRDPVADSLTVYREGLSIGTGWTKVAPGEFGGPTGTDLFCYDQMSGAAQLWGFDLDGGLVALCPVKSGIALGARCVLGAGDFAHNGLGTLLLWETKQNAGGFLLPTPDDPWAGQQLIPPGVFVMTQVLTGRFL